MHCISDFVGFVEKIALPYIVIKISCGQQVAALSLARLQIQLWRASRQAEFRTLERNVSLDCLHWKLPSSHLCSNSLLKLGRIRSVVRISLIAMSKLWRVLRIHTTTLLKHLRNAIYNSVSSVYGKKVR